MSNANSKLPQRTFVVLVVGHEVEVLSRNESRRATYFDLLNREQEFKKNIENRGIGLWCKPVHRGLHVCG